MLTPPGARAAANSMVKQKSVHIRVKNLSKSVERKRNVIITQSLTEKAQSCTELALCISVILGESLCNNLISPTIMLKALQSYSSDPLRIAAFTA